MARLAFNHPNRTRLLAWLHDATARGDAGTDATPAVEAVTHHVEQCERCANRLEELSLLDASDDVVDAGDVGLGSEINGALRELYQPPAGISDRVMRAIDERKRATEELNLFLGLFTIATDAAGLMLPGGNASGSTANDESGREGDETR